MELLDYRRRIDEIDEEIMRFFVERMDISRQIACYKKEHSLPALDTAREQEKLAEICEKAGKELSPYAHTLYLTVFKLSRDYQEVILNL